VIDEAQNLDDSVLETVRMLSNFEIPQAKLIQILLAGQPQLADKLASANLVQLRQRISIFSRLTQFTSAETRKYISHRLQAAGYSGKSLFTPEALAIIDSQSEGIPRNINNLCFHALTLSFANGQKAIDASIVEEVLVDLDVELLDSGMGVKQRTSGDSLRVDSASTSQARGNGSIFTPVSLPASEWTTTVFRPTAPQPMERGQVSVAERWF